MSLDTPASASTQTIEVRPKALWWLVAFTVLNLPGFLAGFVWLLISIFLFFGVLGAIAGLEEAAAEEPGLAYSLNRDDASTDDAVLIYNLRGPIDTGDGGELGSLNENIYTSIVEEDFAQIKANENIKNVVFHLDTPGGTVFASAVLGDLIQDLLSAKGQEEAVFYYYQTVASGGIYASNKVNNYIVGSPYGATGSIGVITYLANVEELADKVGYKQIVIKSGNSKDFGNPFRDLSESEREFIQGQVDDSYNEFVEIVARGRGLTTEQVKERANGYVYDNEQALEFGLLDELGGVEKATERAASNAQLGRYDVLETEAKSELFDLFGGNPLLGKLNLFGENELLQNPEFIRAGTRYYVDPLYLD